MTFTSGLLITAVVILTVYIIIIKLQIRSINRQLEKRLKEHTRQPISLELINSGLNT